MKEKFAWPHYLLPQKKPLQNLKLLWRLGSAVVVPTVACLSKFWMNYLNTVHIINYEVFLRTVSRHYANKSALITISNHNSCLDDPFLYSALFPWTWNLNSNRNRWSSAADDICFTRDWHTVFFALGKTFPVNRGEGIYQTSMDFAVELLKDKQLLHVFPQGKVVDDEESYNPNAVTKPVEQLSLISADDQQKDYDLKWGLARVILDIIDYDELGSGSIELLPFYHIGMNRVLPSVKPYIPRTGKRVTICFREEPIIFNRQFIINTCCNGIDLPIGQRRSAIMRFLANELRILKLKTMRIHHKQ